MRTAVRRDPARPGLDLDDDQRARRPCCSALRARRRGAGRRRPTRCAARPRTTSSRSTSRAGTTSTRRGRDAADDRPVRVLRERDPEVEHDLDQRLPHPRGGLRRPSRRSRSRSRTGSPTCEAARRRGLDVDEFAPRLSFFFNGAQQRLPGGREVPGRAPDVGADHARAVRRQDPNGRGRCASTPRPAASTLTAQQPENNVVRVALQGVRGGLRRHPVAAHERVRRGARAADRAGRDDRAAHAADHRLRVRRRRHRRSVRAARTSSRR